MIACDVVYDCGPGLSSSSLVLAKRKVIGTVSFAFIAGSFSSHREPEHGNQQFWHLGKYKSKRNVNLRVVFVDYNTKPLAFCGFGITVSGLCTHRVVVHAHPELTRPKLVCLLPNYGVGGGRGGRVPRKEVRVGENASCQPVGCDLDRYLTESLSHVN